MVCVIAFVLVAATVLGVVVASGASLLGLVFGIMGLVIPAGMLVSIFGLFAFLLIFLGIAWEEIEWEKRKRNR